VSPLKDESKKHVHFCFSSGRFEAEPLLSILGDAKLQENNVLSLGRSAGDLHWQEIRNGDYDQRLKLS